jgi:hypothetical protein
LLVAPAGFRGECSSLAATGDNRLPSSTRYPARAAKALHPPLCSRHSPHPGPSLLAVPLGPGLPHAAEGRAPRRLALAGRVITHCSWLTLVDEGSRLNGERMDLGQLTGLEAEGWDLICLGSVGQVGWTLGLLGVESYSTPGCR